MFIFVETYLSQKNISTENAYTILLIQQWIRICHHLRLHRRSTCLPPPGGLLKNRYAHGDGSLCRGITGRIPLILNEGQIKNVQDIYPHCRVYACITGEHLDVKNERFTELFILFIHYFLIYYF